MTLYIISLCGSGGESNKAKVSTEKRFFNAYGIIFHKLYFAGLSTYLTKGVTSTLISCIMAKNITQKR